MTTIVDGRGVGKSIAHEIYLQQQGLTATKVSLINIPAVCYYCGAKGYKSDGQGITICERRAYVGRCLGEKDSAQVPKMPSVGRNAPCPCGSGKKYKRCCINKCFGDIVHLL